MQLQFGTNTPIRKDISMPLDQAQKDMTINFTARARDRYEEEDLFTILMRDPDAPGGEYIHFLIINSDGVDPSDGTLVASYIAPQRVGHRYIFEIYLQDDYIEPPIIKDRQGFNVRTFINANDLNKIESITITTTDKNKSANNRGMQVKMLASHNGRSIKGSVIGNVRGSMGGGIGPTPPIEIEEEDPDADMPPVKYHGFVIGGGNAKDISGKNAKYCTCTIEVGEKKRRTGQPDNEYAVCAASTKGWMKECGDYYDYEVMPLEYLLEFADRHDINVPNRKSRRSAADAIYTWKEDEQ